MYLYPREPSDNLGKDARDQLQPVPVEPVGGPMEQDGPDARIAKQDFKTVSRGGIALHDRLYVLAYSSEKGHTLSIAGSIGRYKKTNRNAPGKLPEGDYFSV
jgi:hypothetical protein